MQTAVAWVVTFAVCSEARAAVPAFEAGRYFGERVRWATIDPGIRLYVNAPGAMSAQKPLLLVLYATPNGSTIEQTLGCAKGEGVGWRYDVQHVAAQVRRFREIEPQRSVVLAVTEAPGKSWPAFRQSRADANEVIQSVVREAGRALGDGPMKVALAGHSGGGSFIFGFINGGRAIPQTVERIIFLDANYAYSDAADDRHGDKLLAWLKDDAARHLVVIAYDDREVTLDGKKVVGPQGGTFRATQRMLARFRNDIEVKESADGPFVHYRAPDGRVQLFVHSNPQNKILHTALVGDMNGLLHGLTLGTVAQGKWGAFGGPRAYEKWVQALPERGRPATAPATQPSTQPSTRPTIPSRSEDAPTGSQFATKAAGLSPADREALVLSELLRGNVPRFMRTFAPIHVRVSTSNARRVEVVYFVSPDYLSIGSDDDFLRMPMTPRTAQAAADAFGCALITRKMSNDIFAQAQLKLDPKPLSEDREEVETFVRHNAIIEAQRRAKSERLGLLVAGTKKDVVLSPRLKEKNGRVAIFGWHFSDGRPIQPLSTVHHETYVDYSHGVRLASNVALVDGKFRKMEEIWASDELCTALSDEGTIDPWSYRDRAPVTRPWP
jgi:hypothetical protein